MNSNKLLSVLRDIRLLKFVSVDELQKLANDYPYFQQAHILLAKKYLLETNPDFEEKLHLASIYASGRANLRTIMLDDLEKKERTAIFRQAESIAIEIPVTESLRVNEKELSHASMSDMLPPQDNLLEEESYELVADGNAVTESTAIEELEAALPSEIVMESELSHASMSDMLPPQDNLLEEENYEVVADGNTITESTAIEELEAALPSEVVKEDELSHASMSDVLPPQDSLLEEENYELMTEENASAEAEALEELEVAALPSETVQENVISHASISDLLSAKDMIIKEANHELSDNNGATEDITAEEQEAVATAEPTYTNGTLFTVPFNVNQSHTFTDWLKFIQDSPRALLNKSSAPDYHPISVAEPEPPVTIKIALIEHNQDMLAVEPADNMQAIDEFVAKTTHVSESVKVIPVKSLADKSLEENDELLTETLALIYEGQGLYNKAIRVYAKLSLKFPQKSVYFASLIKELKSKPKL